jgi:hypothetical protein
MDEVAYLGKAVGLQEGYARLVAFEEGSVEDDAGVRRSFVGRLPRPHFLTLHQDCANTLPTMLGLH